MAQDDIQIKIGVQGAEEARSLITSLGDAFAAFHSGLNANMGAVQSWIITANQAIGLVQQLAGGFEMLLRPVEDFGQALLNVAQQMDTIVGMSSAVTGTLGQAFGQSAFQLNEQTERNFFNWAYLYGGPAQGGVPIASQLARWSQKASLYMPYTRQDLMSAITTLAVMPGMTPSAEEKDLALLSDVASTQGRPGLTLQWAAMAALRGGEGYGRMLLMDLNLSEATMRKYGYDKSNPSTFFPALQAYEAARQGGHYTPGSIGQAISTETFWGAQTSFVDRVQNTLLNLGGWNNNATTLGGDVRQGSVFGILKKDLVDVSAWMDAHASQLAQLAAVAGKFFGGITGGATTIFGGFFQALGSSGLVNDILKSLSDFTNLMAQPDTQASLRNIGDMFGKIGGGGLQGTLDALKGLISGLSGSGGPGFAGTELQRFTAWISDPQTLLSIRATAYAVGVTLGDAFALLGSSIEYAALGLKDLSVLFYDVATGNFAKASADVALMAADLKQAQGDISTAMQQLVQSMSQSDEQLAGNALGLGIAGAVTSHPKYAGERFLQLHRGHIMPGTLGGSTGDVTNAAAAMQGQTAAQAFTTTYVAQAQTLMSQHQTSDAIVQPFVTSLQRSIAAGSDLLATTMLHIIQQETQKQLAAALASRDALGNLASRAVGGQRFGTSIGFQ